ncbi:hypothetical protein GCM10025869_29540 [Homoserinibacter gongjuensis]|uniref:Uncharacterized protein n=1 Tax=Homoserinibacter gongjuensis TaxID=1162968 RepID=A0ABQ6K042_9MICO|nr:DUF3093 family protein [Homoserinibacter gongjuensis]GMA92425.1 hypothetical protein GCM10025869_29540 [Homoserinibacter gongjuensis]
MAGPWIFLATALVIPASLLVFLPISTTAGWIVAVVLYGLIVATLLVTTPTVEVADGELRAGRARLPLAVVGVCVPRTVRMPCRNAASGCTPTRGC